VVKLGAHRGLGHQVMALMLVAACTFLLLLNAVQPGMSKRTIYNKIYRLDVRVRRP
jgi:hypothetical protein